MKLITETSRQEPIEYALVIPEEWAVSKVVHEIIELYEQAKWAWGDCRGVFIHPKLHHRILTGDPDWDTYHVYVTGHKNIAHVPIRHDQTLPPEVIQALPTMRIKAVEYG